MNLWGVIHGVKVFTPLMLEQNTECETIYRAVTDGSRQIRYIVGDDAKDLWETRSKLGAQGYVESLLRQVL